MQILGLYLFKLLCVVWIIGYDKITQGTILLSRLHSYIFLLNQPQSIQSGKVDVKRERERESWFQKLQKSPGSEIRTHYHALTQYKRYSNEVENATAYCYKTSKNKRNSLFEFFFCRYCFWLLSFYDSDCFPPPLPLLCPMLFWKENLLEAKKENLLSILSINFDCKIQY